MNRTSKMRVETHQVEASDSLAHRRHAWRTHFLTRLNRWRNQFSRHWWIPLATLAFGLAVQLCLWRVEKPLFVSCGRMIVNFKLSLPEGSLYTEELNNFLGTQAALMQSVAVVGRAHDRVSDRLPALEPQPVALKALIQPKTTIFLLQGAGRDSRYTQEFVQACMEEYINLKKEMRAQTSDTTLAGLTEEVVRLEKELRKCDEELVRFQSSNSVVLLQEQGNSAGNFLAGLTQRLAALKSEYALLQALSLDQVLQRDQREPVAGNALLANGSEAGVFETTGMAGADYARATQQVLMLKAEREDLGQYLRPKHPKMVGLTEEIGRRERLLAMFREQTGRQLSSRKEWLGLEIANLEREVEEWDARALEVSRKSAEFQRLKGNAQRTQGLYDRLLGTMQTLDVNKQISPESVTIMEKASPALADRPGLGQKLGLGAMIGLAAGLGLLGLIERLDDRVGSVTELQELFEEEVLGQIPRERTALRRGEAGLVRAGDERHGFVEAYRNLRSALWSVESERRKAEKRESGNTTEDARGRTVVVTSAVPGEGKSLTASNLAITFANAGARTLLVDGDLRKGSLHERFGLGNGQAGLADAMSGMRSAECGGRSRESEKRESGKVETQEGRLRTEDGQRGAEWERLVRGTAVANLYFLPRGERTERSSELFVGETMMRFLAEASERYDYVILDSAPVLAADDVTSLAPRVDGVLFVVRAEASSARVTRAALDLLYQRGARVLGLVFNAVRPGSAEYYGYYQYGEYGTQRSEVGSQRSAGRGKDE